MRGLTLHLHITSFILAFLNELADRGAITELIILLRLEDGHDHGADILFRGTEGTGLRAREGFLQSREVLLGVVLLRRLEGDGVIELAAVRAGLHNATVEGSSGSRQAEYEVQVLTIAAFVVLNLRGVESDFGSPVDEGNVRPNGIEGGVEDVVQFLGLVHVFLCVVFVLFLGVGA